MFKFPFLFKNLDFFTCNFVFFQENKTLGLVASPFHNRSVSLSLLLPPFFHPPHFPLCLSLVFILHAPSPVQSANPLPAVTSQQAYTQPSGPAVTIAIKRHVIARLQAMSSILRTGLAVPIAGSIVLMVLYHIE